MTTIGRISSFISRPARIHAIKTEYSSGLTFKNNLSVKTGIDIAEFKSKFLALLDSHYPTSKPSEKDGFIKQTLKLNMFTPSKDNHAPFVGDIAYIEYRPYGSNMQQITGRVIDSYHTGIDIQNELTGKVCSIDRAKGRIEEFWTQPQNIGWYRAYVKSPQRAINYIQESNSLFCILTTEIEKKKLVLSGRVSMIEKAPDYKVLQITDKQGIQHFIDLEYLDPVKSSLLLTPADTPNLNSIKCGTAKKAVSIIDSKLKSRAELVDTLLDDIYNKSISIFENPKLYDYLGKNINNTCKLLERWYKDKTGDLRQVFSDHLDPKHIVLLADPGIASRIHKLIEFVKSNSINTKNISPYNLRERFSEFLGNFTVYRGMALNENQVRNIKENGLLAPGLLDQENAQKRLIEFLNPLEKPCSSSIGKTFKEELSHRIDGNDSSLLMSVSHYKDVASSVGWHSNLSEKNSGLQPNLFTINIPAISLIKPKGLFELNYNKQYNLQVDSKIYDLIQDHNVENFIPYVIHKDKFIVNPSEIPPKYEWTKRN